MVCSAGVSVVVTTKEGCCDGAAELVLLLGDGLAGGVVAKGVVGGADATGEGCEGTGVVVTVALVVVGTVVGKVVVGRAVATTGARVGVVSVGGRVEEESPLPFRLVTRVGRDVLRRVMGWSAMLVL